MTESFKENDSFAEQTSFLDWQSARSGSPISSQDEEFVSTTNLLEFANIENGNRKLFSSEMKERDSGCLLKHENVEKKATNLSASISHKTTDKEQDFRAIRKRKEAHDFAVTLGGEDVKRHQSEKADSTLNAPLKSVSKNFSALSPFKEDNFDNTSIYSRQSSLWSVSSSPNPPIQFFPHRTTNSCNMASEGDRNSTSDSRENPSSSTVIDAEQAQSRENEFTILDEEKNTDKEKSNTSPTSEETTKKKKRKGRGLPLSVNAFKSRSERDPEYINQELKVKFTDVIAEPEGYYTPKFSWNLSQEVYGFGKGCCYSVATFFCGIPLAFVWGIWFAFLACLNVWCLVPLRRSNSIKMSCWKGFWSTVVASCCDPVYQSVGMVFNNMNVRTEKHIV